MTEASWSGSALERMGRGLYRLRWAVVLGWAALLLLSAVFAPRATSVLKGGGYDVGHSESIEAYNVLHRAYGFQALIFTAVFASNRPGDAAMLSEAWRFRREASGRFEKRLSVSRPVWTRDRRVILERIYSTPQADFGARFAGPLRDMLPHARVRGYLSGPAAIFHDMEVVSGDDLRRIEIVTLPVAAVVLVLIFGSIVASATPVLMAPLTVSLALAAIYLLGQHMSMSIFVLNATSMIGLGIAIDYSLLMVSRFREELAVDNNLEAVVGRTTATAGRAILVSASVVTVGLCGLALSGVSMLRSLGVGGAIVTALSLAVALTLLPALLGIVGLRINRLSVVPRRLEGVRLWRPLALGVMRHPAPIIGAVGVIIAILAVPAFHLRTGVPGPEILPSSVDSRAGNDVLNAHLGNLNQPPVLIVVQRRPHTPVSTTQSAAFAVLDRVCSSPEVVAVGTVPVADSPSQVHSCQQTLAMLLNPPPGYLARARELARHQSVGLISAFLRSKPSSAEAEGYVSALRQMGGIPGYRVLVGGQTGGQMDFNHNLYGRFPVVVLFVILAIYVLLMVGFRSVLLPLKAVLMNVFSTLAAYGAVVYAFQDGHLARALGFTPVGSIDSIVPVFLFCTLFGVSTDYEVFLLTRVHEEYLRSGNNQDSVARGLEVTGRIITSAAAAMVVVFVGFAFARLVVIQELGVGLAVAVLVDATLIRALLVPATMRLLGRWNWWFPLGGVRKLGPRAPQAAAGKSPAAG